MSKSFLIQRSKQEFMKVSVTLFSEKRWGLGGEVSIKERVFIRIDTVLTIHLQFFS